MELSLTNFSYAVPISSMRVASTSPPIISVTGPSIGNARSILLNDAEVRSEALSRDQVLVEVPQQIIKAGIQSISAVATGPVARVGTVGISFSFEELASTVSGVSALVQRFLKLLLTSKGTSYQNMAEGGGVLGMVASADGESLNSGLLVDAVTITEQYMKNDPKFSDLDPSERLLSAEVLSTSWDRNAQTASVIIKITNQLGETLESGVSL